jgi:ketosteroid isomerase-like protein
MTKGSDYSDIALRFVARINAHDVQGLIEMMTEDHVIVDSLGNESSRPAIEDGWKQYFAMVPDYWIKIDRVLVDRDTAILFGSAGGTYVPKGGNIKVENKWETPAVWVTKLKDAKVLKWRIYSDNEPIRDKMRRTMNKN